MTAPFRVLNDLFEAFNPQGPGLFNDPGDAGTITFDGWGQVCSVATTSAETRTLAQPIKPGILAAVVLDTDGGNMALTVTGGYNADADTLITFADAGDYVCVYSVKVGSSYYWRVLQDEGVTLNETVSSTLKLSTPVQLTRVQGPNHPARVPMATFIFDDGHTEALDLAEPVFTAQGEVACSAIITSVIGGTYQSQTVLTAANLATLEAAGWEILSHSVTHPTLADENEATNISEMADSLATLRGLGLTVESFIAPFKSMDALSRTICQRYYRACRTLDLDTTRRNGSRIETYMLSGHQMSAAIGGMGANDAIIKAHIDAAYAAGEWLILFTHRIDASDATELGVLIDYIQAKGDMPIYTMKQALDLCENTFESGDITDGEGVALGATGTIVCKGVTLSRNSSFFAIAAGGLGLETTTVADTSAGLVTKAGFRWAHDYHDTVAQSGNLPGGNLFMGKNAGNLTLGATATADFHSSNLVGIGDSSLNAVTKAFACAFIGVASGSLVTEGSNLAGCGDRVLGGMTDGIRCTGLGSSAGRYAGAGTTPNQTTQNSDYIGYLTRASADGADYECVIGSEAIGLGAGLVVIGGPNHTEVIFPSLIVTMGDGGTTDYAQVSATGDITFNGSAGFYPRLVSQNTEPAAGTGATQIDTGEAIIWDKADTGNIYLMFNDAGTPKKVELT